VFTALVLEVFRVNGRLLASGDSLVADIGLTSARWQVLGAIHYAGTPQTVSILARSMGLTRQAVQRLANDLAAKGLITFEPNPTHRRAQLVAFTPAGQTVYQAASQRQIPWANAIATGSDPRDLETALATLVALRLQIDVIAGDAQTGLRSGPEKADG